jgi:hypothetical protein
MRGDNMLDLFNFKKKREQNELKKKLLKDSIDSINKVQMMACLAQNILKIQEDYLIAKAKENKLRNEANQVFKINEGR